jgi:hypothetical protein
MKIPFGQLIDSSKQLYSFAILLLKTVKIEVVVSILAS